MATTEMNWSEGSGKAAYSKSVTLQKDSGSSTSMTFSDVGFQPDVIIVVTPNYYYTYYSEYSATTASACPNSAWADGANRYSGTFQNNCIVPNANGFVFTVVSSLDWGTTAKVFCYAL